MSLNTSSPVTLPSSVARMVRILLSFFLLCSTILIGTRAPVVQADDQPPPTPTRTPDPTIQPTDSSAPAPIYLPLLVVPKPTVINGDFESGSGVGWTEHSVRGFSIIYSNAPVTPVSGTRLAWLGGASDETSEIKQELRIPALDRELMLTYNYRISSQETVCGVDKFSMLIDNVPMFTTNLCQQANTSKWVRKDQDMSDFAGKTVTVTFRVTTNSSLNSNLFIDDVSFEWKDELNPLSPMSVPTACNTPSVHPLSGCGRDAEKDPQRALR